MATLISYLTFNGNCRQAMRFYQACFQGELTLQAVGESPLSEPLPVFFKQRIVHAVLTRGDLVLMGSDLVPDGRLLRGNAVALLLACSNEPEIRTLYARLASGGVRNHPLAYTHWGTLTGDLTDKFGNHWMLTYHKHKMNQLNNH